MILPFSTQINGKPTFFVEKIHSGLIQRRLMDGFDLGYDHNFDLDVVSSCEPKLHTIRDDKNNRWNTTRKIDFFINCRQKNMFRFAPVLQVVSVQKIEIKNMFNDQFAIEIDGRKLTPGQIDQLATNDGFDSTVEFWEYFSMEDFKGKIIHWTELKY